LLALTSDALVVEETDGMATTDDKSEVAVNDRLDPKDRLLLAAGLVTVGVGTPVDEELLPELGVAPDPPKLMHANDMEVVVGVLAAFAARDHAMSM